MAIKHSIILFGHPFWQQHNFPEHPCPRDTLVATPPVTITAAIPSRSSSFPAATRSRCRESNPGTTVWHCETRTRHPPIPATRHLFPAFPGRSKSSSQQPNSRLPLPGLPGSRHPSTLRVSVPRPIPSPPSSRHRSSLGVGTHHSRHLPFLVPATTTQIKKELWSRHLAACSRHPPFNLENIITPQRN